MHAGTLPSRVGLWWWTWQNRLPTKRGKRGTPIEVTSSILDSLIVNTRKEVLTNRGHIYIFFKHDFLELPTIGTHK